MPTQHDIGDAVTFSHEVRDASGTLVTPTSITATVTDPSGATTSPTPTATATGMYEATASATEAGRWLVQWSTTDPDNVDYDLFDVLADPPARLQPLATIADLEDRIGTLNAQQAARAPGLLIDASAKVRGVTRQVITRVDDDQMILRAVGHLITLPQRPVLDVTAVALVDGDTDRPLTGWVWAGLEAIDLRPARLTSGAVEHLTNRYRVTTSHGYEPGSIVMDGVVAVVAGMVNRVLTSPTMVEGATQEVIGQVSTQYQQARGSAGTGVRLFRSDRDDLADLGLIRRSGSVKLRAR